MWSVLRRDYVEKSVSTAYIDPSRLMYLRSRLRTLYIRKSIIIRVKEKASNYLKDVVSISQITSNNEIFQIEVEN